MRGMLSVGCAANTESGGGKQGHSLGSELPARLGTPNIRRRIFTTRLTSRRPLAHHAALQRRTDNCKIRVAYLCTVRSTDT